MRTIDMAGKIIGSFTVIERLGSRKGVACWSIRCACGNIRTVRGSRLRVSPAPTCRCGAKNHKDSSAYWVWTNMRSRCQRKTNKHFKNYGGRGITVFEAWNDFEVFIRDMGPRPSQSHSIERLDNDKGYGPDNCKWATKQEQVRNTRSNVRFLFRGKSLILSDFARIEGFHQSTISKWLKSGKLKQAYPDLLVLSVGVQ